MVRKMKFTDKTGTLKAYNNCCNYLKMLKILNR